MEREMMRRETMLSPDALKKEDKLKKAEREAGQQVCGMLDEG
jgi:hypothetical protein